ncbi:MAG: TIGR03032 family protein [Elainellaceae cyanobacterium]
MTQQRPVLEVKCTPQLLDWLAEQQLSLALTTYQSARLILLGQTSERQLSGFERLFDRAMGLFTTSERLYLSSRYQIWQLDNVLAPGQLYNGYDKLYVPRIGYTTGDLDIHDIAVDRTGQVIFVSSLLNCLATLSSRNSCKPLWHPPFISQIINEDRCHLNGLAMVEGVPGYVTACSQSDVGEGWRSNRQNGGCVIDLQSEEIVCNGLSMPHSPRFYNGKLWLLNSGRGEFGFVDLDAGRFEPVTFCPGYLRGLAFWQQFAIVGLSRPRHGEVTFSGLALDERLVAEDRNPFCGVVVIDLRTGKIIHWLQFEGVIRELYDVQIIPGARRPMALGFQTDEIAQLLTLDPYANDKSWK